MRLRVLLAASLLLLPAVDRAPAQTPVAFGPLDPPAALAPSARRAVTDRALPYPFVGFRRFAEDSVLLVFDDATLTANALQSHTWMFGPPVSAAEADSCPPEKVLGRRIARTFWIADGRPATTQLIIVAVRGTRGIDRWTVESMYYPRGQLAAPWIGDKTAR